eukprot:s1568_g13.t1
MGVPTASHMREAHRHFGKKMESGKAASRDVKGQEMSGDVKESRVRVPDGRSAPYWLPETLGCCYRKRHVCHVVHMEICMSNMST